MENTKPLINPLFSQLIAKKLNAYFLFNFLLIKTIKRTDKRIFSDKFHGKSKHNKIK